jgi:hypothetical protein
MPVRNLLIPRSVGGRARRRAARRAGLGKGAELLQLETGPANRKALELFRPCGYREH